MHYYQHHIGDFIKDTSYLSNEEVGVYMKLIWIYYDTEQPLPNNINELALKTNSRSCLTVVEQMLKIFFVLTDDGWRHARCDREIAEYRSFIDKKSRAGKASAERRLSNSVTRVEQVLNSSDTVEQLTTNHKPLTNIETTPKVVKGTRWQKGYAIPDNWIAYCKQKRPDLNPKDVFESFTDYWISVAGAKGVKLDWDATWRTWVRNQRAVAGKPQQRNQFAGAI